MDAIFIPQLTKAPERTEEIQVQEFLPGLETLTPVRGVIQVKHQGNYLEVSSQAETIVTCTCNRCLQQYNHRLVLNAQEVIWLDETANQTEDLPVEMEVLNAPVSEKPTDSRWALLDALKKQLPDN